MHFSSLAIAAIAGATLGLCAPAAEPVKELFKRNTCTLIGYTMSSQDIIGGGQPWSQTGFELYYVGGKFIKQCDLEQNGSDCDSFYYKGVTIPQQLIGSAESIMWWPENNLFNFEGCRISYEGKGYGGYMNGAINPCAGLPPGYTCSYCSADFHCEGNLPSAP